MGSGSSKSSKAKLEGRKSRESGKDSFAVSDRELGIDEDSYIYSDEYKTLVSDVQRLSKEYSELEEKGNTIEKYKPKEQWNDLDKFMAENFMDKPVSNEYSKYLKDLNILSKKSEEATDKLDKFEREVVRNRVKFRDIPNKEFNGKSKYIDTTSTRVSYYDDFLNPSNAKYLRDNKGLAGKVVSMSPKEYLQRCADQVFGNSTYERQVRAMNRANIKKYSLEMKKGSKAPLPYLNLSNKNTAQEGRHRALATMLLGEEQIPVLVVYDV